jgi:hypothetical protein
MPSNLRLLNIDKFLQELSNYIYQTQDEIENSMLILLCLEKGLIRVKLGEKVSNYLTNDSIFKMIIRSDNYFNSEQYDKLLIKFLDNIYYNYKYGNIIYLFLSLGLLILIFFKYYFQCNERELAKNNT